MPTREVEEITNQVDHVRLSKEEPDREVPAPGMEGTEVRPSHFRHILVGVDGSEGAQKAFDWGEQLARAQGAELTVAFILPTLHPIADRPLPAMNPKSAKLWRELADAQEREARGVLGAAAEEATRDGVKVRTRLERGPVVATLVEIAQREKCDLIVVGSHGRRGVKRFLLGSVAEGVKDHGTVSVLIARNRPPQRKAILAVDGSETSRRAAKAFAGLLQDGATWAHVLHVIPAPVEAVSEDLRGRWLAATEEIRQPLLDRFRLPAGSWVHYDLQFGDPADEILQAVEDDEAGLVVLGSRGHTWLETLVSGSVSGRVARHAPASVLLIK